MYAYILELKRFSGLITKCRRKYEGLILSIWMIPGAIEESEISRVSTNLHKYLFAIFVNICRIITKAPAAALCRVLF